ncbi:hypothetical protein B0H17DRAFT_363393 [Mycena rosella]|uniref:Mid2 domain-containing protein n=1 Tax=Mycena rosella TaxID=1033263 RepID=A0AAD7GZD3_MYCRO|nr:hypothetical protein B0H17DRAFT_363393 [Mycena rosella]
MTPGPIRLNFTKEANDPIGAFFNIAVASNATRIANNTDLSVGFVDVDIQVLPGTYSIFAFGNDTGGGGDLGSSANFLVIDAPSAPANPTSSANPTSASSITSSSATSSVSGTTVAGQTAPPSNSAVMTSKKSPSTAIIAGVVISVLVLLVVLILFLFLRRRKQQRTQRRDSHGTLEAPGPMMQSSAALTSESYLSSHVDPFITPLSSKTSLSSPQQRQQYLTNEMRLVRKQMEELRRTGNGTNVSSSGPASSTMPSPTTTSNTDASARDLERSRQQNDELQSRIALLEAQLQSAWALGLSNDPPPGYVA